MLIAVCAALWCVLLCEQHTDACRLTLVRVSVFVQVTPDQIKAAVAEAINSKKEQLLEER